MYFQSFPNCPATVEYVAINISLLSAPQWLLQWLEDPLTSLPVSRPHCITASCSLRGASGSSSLRAGRSSMSNGVNGPRTKNSRWWQRQETRAQGVIGREEMIYYIKHLSFFLFLWPAEICYCAFICYPFISFKFLLFIAVSDNRTTSPCFDLGSVKDEIILDHIK